MKKEEEDEKDEPFKNSDVGGLGYGSIPGYCFYERNRQGRGFAGIKDRGKG